MNGSPLNLTLCLISKKLREIKKEATACAATSFFMDKRTLKKAYAFRLNLSTAKSLFTTGAPSYLLSIFTVKRVMKGSTATTAR